MLCKTVDKERYERDGLQAKLQLFQREREK